MNPILLRCLVVGMGLQGFLRSAEPSSQLTSPLAPAGTTNPIKLRYPGPSPGPARGQKLGGSLLVSNAVLQARWTVGTAGLGHVDVSDLQTGQSLRWTGQVFQILLSTGQRYTSSHLLPAGEPHLKSVPARPEAARLAERQSGWVAEVPLQTPDGLLNVTWRAILRDDANVVRQELSVSPVRERCVIREVTWLEGQMPHARTLGSVDGSPIVASSFFLGAESPHARNRASADAQPDGSRSVACRVPVETVLEPHNSLEQSLVIGVAPPHQMRRAFACYLEQERAHPYRPFLHYNSWYDIAWSPFALNETNCLEAIHLLGERFIRAHGVELQAMVFDDGWDDPRTLWQFHKGFPEGFAPLAKAVRGYGTHLGVWLSPFGGYGEPKRQRLEFGRAQGFETNATGFSLAGPRYYGAFKAACVDMIRSYGANHFKFDGIAAGMYANGSANYLADTEAMRRLMTELRQEDPTVYINLTTGSWPSPFWLRHADSIWRQGGDMGLAGKGPRQQQWLTYRDQETYRNIVIKGPLYPLNSLMTQGVAYSRHGSAGDPSFDSAGFKDDVRAFFASGTGLQELYIQPGKLTPDDWGILAEAARWSRARAEVLVDTHWIGGDPGKLEVYGWGAWSGQRGTVALRNPDATPHSFDLDIAVVLELPPASPRSFRLRSPWQEDADAETRLVEAGTLFRMELAPFQVLVFDVTPAR